MIVTEIIMKLNIVQGLYIVLRPNTNSRKIPGFHGGGGGVQSQDTTADPPCTPDPPCIKIIY